MDYVYRKDEFVILASSRGYVVANLKGHYANHSHFNSLSAAKQCIRFTQKKLIPKKSRYMLIACKRLSIDEQYIDSIEEFINNPKDKYIYENLMRHTSYKRVHGALKQR